MNEPPSLESASSLPSAPMPLLARMVNVFAVPGEVFEDVKRYPNAPGSWLVPILVACVVGTLSAIVLFSQPAILQEMRQMREKAMQQQVEKGKMTQKQADQVMDMVDRFSTPTVMKVTAAAGAVVVSFARVFWWAFALWLLALLLLRARISYLKALEVTGLSSLIGTLGILVTLLLQINLGRSTATPSLALAVSHFDPSNKMHMVLAALNLVQVWMVIIMGVGLARLTDQPVGRASLWVVAFYFLQTSALVLVGAGMSTL